MLLLTVPSTELYIPETLEFKTLPAQQLQLEHSLISLSKWESEWKTSFLSSKDMTVEQLLSYVKCMTINKVTDESVYTRLTAENITQVRDYIDDPMTATTIRKDDGKRYSRKVITTEEIYGWMVQFGIPFDPCEKWHLNRLMMLIEVCGVQQSGGGKKMSAKERGAWMRAQHQKRKGHRS